MKILKMIKSEFIKIFARKSTWIIIVLSILLIVVGFSINKVFDRISEYNYYEDMAKWEGQNLKDITSEYREKTDKYSKLIIQMADYRIESLNQIKDMDIVHNEWKNGLYGEYEDIRDKLLLLSLLKSGYKLSDIDKANLELGDTFYIDEELSINYDIMTKKELEEYAKKLKNENDELHELLLGDKGYSDYLEREIKNDRKNIEDNKKMIEANTKLINNKNTSKDEKANLEKSNSGLNLDIEKLENIMLWKQYMIDNNIKEKDWQYNIIQEIIEYYSSAYKSLTTLTEDQYYKSEEYAQYKKQKLSASYEDYVKINQKRNETIENQFRINTYAIENNINISDGSRQKLKDFNSIYGVIGIVAIIIAGTIVAREFSTGSIRMLLIRPVKRWKILTAKLCTALIFMIVLTVILFITGFATTGICYGFNDFIVHDLTIKAGKVVEVSFFLDMLKRCSILMIPITFFVIFAFILSTVLRSTAVAIALPIAGMLGGQIVQSLFFAFPKVWLSYTPVPYIAFSELIGDSYTENTIYELNILHHMNISILNGTLIYLALLAIIIPIAYTVFNKIDVKNQ